jgi:hypothetical protein
MGREFRLTKNGDDPTSFTLVGSEADLTQGLKLYNVEDEAGWDSGISHRGGGESTPPSFSRLQLGQLAGFNRLHEDIPFGRC